MKEKLLFFLVPLIRGPIGKAGRHALSLLAGWIIALPHMQGHGAIDPASLASLLTGLGMLALVSVWSVATKRFGAGDLSPEVRSSARLFIESIVGHLVPLLAGFMAAKGYAGAPDDSAAMAEWLALGAVNYLRSLLQRPDAKLTGRRGAGDDDDDYSDDFPPGVLGLVLPFALAAMMLGLGGCASLDAGARDWTVRACVELPVGRLLAPDPDPIDAGLFPAK